MSCKENERPDAKPISASRVTLSQLMQPEHANLRGDVHGGWILKLVDEAGALSAMRHAQSRVVTVAVDQMHFHQPIRIGDLVILNAEVSYVGRTSIETRIEVTAESPVSGARTHTNSAYVVYVALDEEDRPKAVPSLIAESKQQARRIEAGRERQELRLSRKKQEQDGG